MAKSLIEGKIVAPEEIFLGGIEFDEESGLITDVRSGTTSPSQAKDYEHVFRYSDYLIFPGFIDIHVHAREDTSGKNNYKEDFMTAAKAARNGGVVAFFTMPNDPVPPVDLETYLAKVELSRKAMRETGVNIRHYYAIMPGSKPFDVNAPAKSYLGPSTGNIGFERDEDIALFFYNLRKLFIDDFC